MARLRPILNLPPERNGSPATFPHRLRSSDAILAVIGLTRMPGKTRRDKQEDFEDGRKGGRNVRI